MTSPERTRNGNRLASPRVAVAIALLGAAALFGVSLRTQGDYEANNPVYRAQAARMERDAQATPASSEAPRIYTEDMNEVETRRAQKAISRSDAAIDGVVVLHEGTRIRRSPHVPDQNVQADTNGSDNPYTVPSGKALVVSRPAVYNDGATTWIRFTDTDLDTQRDASHNTLWVAYSQLTQQENDGRPYVGTFAKPDTEITPLAVTTDQHGAMHLESGEAAGTFNLYALDEQVSLQQQAPELAGLVES